jgi:4'-phosphopantetheinyl transferase
LLILLTALEPGSASRRPGSSALSPAERARAARLKGQRREQYLAGRSLLREACARLGGGRPQDWRLNPEGLPQAASPGRRAPWLSLTHSGGFLAAAASWRPGLGLDLERLGQPRDWKGLHRLLKRWELPPAKPAWPLAPVESAFLGDWSRYEAAFKAWHSFKAAGLQPGAVRAWTLQGKDLILSICSPDGVVPSWAWVGPGALRAWQRCPRPWDLDLARMRA